jgi:hypothetical protein
MIFCPSAWSAVRYPHPSANPPRRLFAHRRRLGRGCDHASNAAVRSAVMSVLPGQQDFIADLAAACAQ